MLTFTFFFPVLWVLNVETVCFCASSFVRYKRLRDKSMRLLTAEDTNTFKTAASPASCAADRSPATSPSTTTAKHIWTANNSFRFLRLALLLRLFSITPPPPTAVSGIPSTTTRAMALFFRRAFRLNTQWWRRDPRNWGERGDTERCAVCARRADMTGCWMDL